MATSSRKSRIARQAQQAARLAGRDRTNKIRNENGKPKIRNVKYPAQGNVNAGNSEDKEGSGSIK